MEIINKPDKPRLQIFIADDSLLFRKRLIEMISVIPGIEIIGEADNGIGAIKGVQALYPDLVILDIQMPKGSGIEVLKQIKEEQSVSKVMMVTNYPYSQYGKKCKEIGADYFFNKPNEFELIKKVISQLAMDFNK